MLSSICIVGYSFYKHKWNEKEAIAILISILLTITSLIQSICNAYSSKNSIQEIGEINKSILISQDKAIEMLRQVDAKIDDKNIDISMNTVSEDDKPDDEVSDWVVKNRNDIIYKDDIFFVDIKCRKKGDKKWERGIEANVGDIIEFQAEYVNRGKATVRDIMVRGVLPTNMKYVEDSTILYNSNYQVGINIPENTVTSSGLNIGSYNYQGNAYVRFCSEVIDVNLANGNNQLITWISITQNGEALRYDTSVFVKK